MLYFLSGEIAGNIDHRNEQRSWIPSVYKITIIQLHNQSHRYIHIDRLKHKYFMEAKIKKYNSTKAHTCDVCMYVASVVLLFNLSVGYPRTYVYVRIKEVVVVRQGKVKENIARPKVNKKICHLHAKTFRFPCKRIKGTFDDQKKQEAFKEHRRVHI